MIRSSQRIRKSDITIWASLIVIGVIAGTLGGLVGFGASVILLPVLTLAFGAKQAVPIMAIAALIGNAARICVWWRDVDWRAAGAFAITAAPGAAFGAQTLIALNEYWVEIGLGIFLIIVVPLRRAMSRAGRTVTLA
ncbi:MAG: TSUP family transporter, partial [Rhodospirillales bacterium]